MNGDQAISRRYRSPIREERAAHTRGRILDSAREQFRAHGYAATTLAQIADTAGVSVQTVYNSIGGKAAVLLALNDLIDELADVGSTQQRIAQSEDPAEIIGLAAHLRRVLMERAGDIVDLIAGGAQAEADVASVYADGQSRSRAGITRLVGRLDTLGALREDLDVERGADMTYAVLHHQVWSRLVDECGWHPDDFERWCADLLRWMLLRSP